jgi:hypothetical protein
MGIDVRWKSESGELLGFVEDNGASTALWGLFYRQSSSACVRFIDPAGDACFNQLQLPVLLAEIRQLLPAVAAARDQAYVRAVAGLVERAVRPHTYVWFVGD